MNIPFFRRGVCLTLIAAFLLSALSLLPISAQTDAEYSLDFSDPDCNFNITVSPSELLSLLYPSEAVSDSEASYVDTYFEHTLLYSDNVSSANVEAAVSDEKISVTAKQYSYAAKGGKKITWSPVSAKYGDEEKALTKSGSVYVCEFSLSESLSLTVAYSCSIELPEAAVSELANFAYAEQSSANKLYSDYQTAVDSYNKACAEYDAYLDALDKYEVDVDLYDEYLIKKDAYDKKLAEYNNYLSLLAKYKSDCVAYEKYQEEYRVYLEKKAEYERIYSQNAEQNEKYKAYLANLAAIRSSMTAIESIYITPENGVGPLFQALQNAEIIGMIERHQSTMVTYYGVKASDITAMRTASDELTDILVEYNAAREESEEAAFAFYKANYHEISEKFNYLYDKMTVVLTRTIFLHVCTLLESVEYKNDPEMAEYKKWRIRNVLCHIYLICEALDDNATSNSTWKFYQDNGDMHTYDFSDLLAKNVILTDTNASCPDSLEWQSGDEFADFKLPTPPVMPDEVLEPTAPIEITEPTAPTVIEKPQPPTEVSAPSSKPTLTEDEQNLIRRTQTLSSLSQRELPDSLTVSFSKNVVRPFSADGSGVSAYYGVDGALLSLSQEPDAPSAPEHPQYVYEFFYWDMTEIGNDKLFYPVFGIKDEQKTYTVSFKYSEDDAEPIYSCVCAYGETPSFVGDTPTKTSSSTTDYTFSGWYPQIMPTKADITYVAQFDESQRLYTVNWSVLDKVTTKYLPYGTEPTPPTVKTDYISENSYYQFLNWDKQPSKVTKNVTYTASYKITPLVSADGQVSVSDSGNGFGVVTGSTDTVISGLLSIAAEKQSEIKITFGDIIMTVSKQAVESLKKYDAHTLSFFSSPMTLSDESKGAFGFNFLSESGNPIRYMGDVYLSIPYASSGSASAENTFISFSIENGAMGKTSCSVNGDRLEFTAFPSRSYSVSQYFKLTVSHNDGGTVFVSNSLYGPNDRVYMDIKPNNEFVISKITITDSQGNVTDITGSEYFLMPASDTTLNVEFATKTYTITFVSNGEVIETQQLALGETVVPPDVPASFEKDGYIYSFIGWDKVVAAVSADAVYTAKYNAVRADLKETENSDGASGKVFTSHILPIIIMGIILVGAFSGLIVLIIKTGLIGLIIKTGLMVFIIKVIKTIKPFKKKASKTKKAKKAKKAKGDKR